jgi:hypothetical protein
MKTPHAANLEAQWAEHRERAAALMAGGMSAAKAADVLGVGRSTLHRILANAARTANTGNCGRPSTIEKYGVTEDMLATVKGMALDLGPTLAWRKFAGSRACPVALADCILGKSRKSYIAPALMDAVRPAELVQDAHRGPRRLGLNIWTPRELDVLPGDIFTCDDTTPIFGWYVPWPISEKYPYGEKLLQGQYLPVLDVASQRVLGGALIAREAGSYRAVDIWALFGHIMQMHGLPRLGWQLERGTFESRMLCGIKLELDAADSQRTPARRMGGLRALPCTLLDWHRAKAAEQCFDLASDPDLGQGHAKIFTSYSPNSKPIEGWFNRAQRLEATLYGCLGRDQMRNPFEKAKKRLQACQQGREKPSLHWPSQAELIRDLEAIWLEINREPLEGRVFRGVPDMLWNEAVRSYPLAVLPPEQRWLYARDWRAARVQRNAMVQIDLKPMGGKDHFYAAKFLAPLAGQPVHVYYDATNPGAGVEVLRPIGSRLEYLGRAEWERPAGMFLDGRDTAKKTRKATVETVRTMHATTAATAPSRQLPAAIADRRKAEKQEAATAATATAATAATATRPARPAASRDTAAPAPAADVWARRRAEKPALAMAQAASDPFDF